MDNENRMNRETIQQALMNYYDNNGQSMESMMDEMAHMIHDYHDFQMTTRKISRGKFINN